MTLRFAFAIVLLLCASLLVGQTVAPTAPAAPAGAVGRYQLIMVGTAPGNYEAWLVDTQTGDTWRRPGNSGKWVFTGNPTQDPGPKFPAPRAPASAPQILPER